MTGAQGCIGSWVVKNLVERGARPVVYDLTREPRRMRLIMSPEQIAQVTFLEDDVRDLEGLCRAIEEHDITHILHLAALQVPACRENPVRGALINVIGTLNVFEAAKRTGCIQRIVYASSCAVYGRPEEYPSPAPHEALLTPHTHYGVFKVCNEGNARVYWEEDGLSSIGLRPWTVYGPGRDQGLTSAPTKAVKAAVVGREYRIPYGGYNDLQFVDDVAKSFLRCLEVPFEGAAVYNLRGQVVSMAEVIATIEEVVPEAKGLLSHGQGQIPMAYDLDDTPLQREVGDLPRTPLREGIRQTVEVFRRLQAEGRLETTELEA
ncbi:MAG TPA: NAD(P)-dependent oxidoreductase [Armatimonadetes bacterium]|nr:NAD(P)-dependent oxidoreductase [Armatimonadota bacterium]